MARPTEPGLRIEDYAVVREESVTGERAPARFVWLLGEPSHAEPAPVRKGGSFPPRRRSVTLGQFDRTPRRPSLHHPGPMDTAIN